jgi:hypothetical protein
MAATSTELLNERLRNQQLTQSTRRKPAQVVSWLGAMQAQDYPAAKWAIGLRAPGCMNADIDQAFNDGAILRTHVLRPTWHFVAPVDIRWMLALTGPRIVSASGGRWRELGLDAATMKKSMNVIERALADGRTLTRAELAAALAKARITTEGQRLAHVVMHAELTGLVCSGPVRGKQFTYALLASRVPAAPADAPGTREAHVAELVRRYFTTHGPATAHDFAWWSGLGVGDARRGVAALGRALASAEHDGATYWFDPAAEPAPAGSVHLLPPYDEHFVGFRDRAALLERLERAGRSAETRGIFANVLTVDGQFAGSWTRAVKKGRMVVSVAPLVPLTAAQRRAATRAAEAYGNFAGMEVDVAMSARDAGSRPRPAHA